MELLSPTAIDLFKVNNVNNVNSKLNLFKDKKTPEGCQWRHSSVFIVNFEQITHLLQKFLLLTLNKQMPNGNKFDNQKQNYSWKFIDTTRFEMPEKFCQKTLKNMIFSSSSIKLLNAHLIQNLARNSQNTKYKIQNYELTKVSIWAFSNMRYIFQKLTEKSLSAFCCPFWWFLYRK